MVRNNAIKIVIILAIIKHKEEAVASVKGKQMIAFVVDGTPYLVFNTDGSYANKALAIALEDGIVNIKGKMNVVGGMNTIIADIIE